VSARLAKRSTAGRAHAARGGKSKSAAPSRKSGDTPNGFSLRDMQAAVALATSRMRARFDAAETTDDNRKHWAPADGLSADMAASPGVRRILRNRCRYEVANNTYAFGMADTLANDCVGTGPRLQLTGLDRKAARYIEREFKKWAKAVGLAEKLRTMRRARVVDGEAFGLFINNPQLSTRVRLDIRLLEAEQCASSAAALPQPQSVDGIRYDAAGNASVYEILPEHPGGRAYTTLLPIAVDASKVLHFFVAQRPGQRRGIPELTPALPLFAQLRRWTLSVLAAAETAADLAGIIQTQGAPEGGEVEAAAAFERVEFERRALMTLPEGYAVSQLKAEQPTSTYKEVKREILNEIARSVQVPFNVAAGNSADYNYSSGRLDFQIYERAVMIDRERMETQVLERVFAEWVREAVLIEDYLPQPLRLTSTDWSHAWYWPGFAHIDPKNEAEAQEVRLRTKTTTLADEWAREGEDWEEKLEAIARIEQRQRELSAQYGNGAREDVQVTALNGIQIQAMTGVLGQIAAKTLTPAAGVVLLQIAFPNVDPQRIKEMVAAQAGALQVAPQPQAATA
jgi:lambda family phage portal protein